MGHVSWPRRRLSAVASRHGISQCNFGLNDKCMWHGVSLSLCVREKSVAYLCACLAQSATSLLTLSYCKLIWPEMISSVLKSELVVLLLLLLLPCRVVSWCCIYRFVAPSIGNWQLAAGSNIAGFLFKWPMSTDR